MKVRVGYKDFRVRPMTDAEIDVEAASGFCRKAAGEIAVSPHQDPADQADTLLHEVLHGLWHTQDLPPQVDEEKAVTMLAHGLCQVLRDNPMFLGVLTAALDGASVFPKRRRKSA